MAEEEGILENTSNQHANLGHLPTLSPVGEINYATRAVCLRASVTESYYACSLTALGHNSEPNRQDSKAIVKLTV